MAISRVKNWVAEILTFTDLNAEFNNVLNNALSLISPLTANLAAGSFKITGLAAGTTAGDAVRFEQAILQTLSTVASAAVPDIFASTVAFSVDYTGAVTATGFVAALQAGARRRLICASTAAFTAGANMLIDGLPSGATWTAIAGDQVDIVAVTTTQFRLTPLVSALTLLKVKTASASATVDFTTEFTAAYDSYMVRLTDIIPATDASDLWLRISQATVFLSGAADYRHSRIQASEGGAVSTIGSAGDTQIVIANALTSDAASTYIGEVTFANPSGTTRNKHFIHRSSYSTTTPVHITTSGAGAIVLNTTAVDGIRFLMSAGNLTSGTFSLYGIRKA